VYIWQTVQALGRPEVGSAAGEPRPKYVVIGQHGTRDDDVGRAGDLVRLREQRRGTSSGVVALIFEV